MWPFTPKTLKDRYSKLVKLIMSIDSHFQITEDKEKSVRLHLPNYKGNQPMDFDIYLMEPQLHISFVTEIEGEKISVLSYFDQNTDQQDMFNKAMARNLNKIHEVLGKKYSEEAEDEEEHSKEKHQEQSSKTEFRSYTIKKQKMPDGEEKYVATYDDKDSAGNTADEFNFNESFKKHALSLIVFRPQMAFWYYSHKDDTTPTWLFNPQDGLYLGDEENANAAGPFMWIIMKNGQKEEFCYLLDLLDKQIAHMWVDAYKEPEEIINDIKRYIPSFKLGNDPHRVHTSLQWLWIDLHAILHFIDYCMEKVHELAERNIKVVNCIQDCNSIEELARLYMSDFKLNFDTKDEKDSIKEDEPLSSEKEKPSIVKTWSLLDFARAHGKMKLVPPSKHIDSRTGEEFIAPCCAFVHPIKKDKEGRPKVTFIGISSELRELTAKEIGEQKDDLVVVEYESGDYSLKRKGIEEKKNSPTEVTEAVCQMDNIANKNDNIESTFCKYCGRRIEANSKFCVYCGKQLNPEVFVLKDFPNNIISALPVNSQEDLDEIISIGKESMLSKDYQRAYFFLREAARFGDAESAFITGQLLYNGDGVEKNEERAITFFMQAAENCYFQAYNNIGVCYALGKGVPKDMSKAVSWYQKGADKGDKLAQNSLGRCYLIGDGVEKNLELGIYWTKKSAEQGYNGSLFNMGYCYEMGLGVPKDLSKAIHYYKEALEKGYHQAEQRLKIIQNHK